MHIKILAIGLPGSGVWRRKTARAEQAVMSAQGIRAFLTTDSWTITNLGDPVNMPFVNLNKRIKALTCRNDVDAIIAIDPCFNQQK
jgi:hypothetical protein